MSPMTKVVFCLEEKGCTRTRPCRDKPRLAKRGAAGQDTGRAQIVVVSNAVTQILTCQGGLQLQNE
jgi:hypothetical protein